jgi:hypothetical protein
MLLMSSFAGTRDDVLKLGAGVQLQVRFVPRREIPRGCSGLADFKRGVLLLPDGGDETDRRTRLLKAINRLIALEANRANERGALISRA